MMTTFISHKDKPTSDHVLTADAELVLDDVLLPGQKCHRRRNAFSDFCKDILQPIRACISEYAGEEKLKR